MLYAQNKLNGYTTGMVTVAGVNSLQRVFSGPTTGVSYARIYGNFSGRDMDQILLSISAMMTFRAFLVGWFVYGFVGCTLDSRPTYMESTDPATAQSQSFGIYCDDALQTANSLAQITVCLDDEGFHFLPEQGLVLYVDPDNATASTTQLSIVNISEVSLDFFPAAQSKDLSFIFDGNVISAQYPLMLEQTVTVGQEQGIHGVSVTLVAASDVLSKIASSVEGQLVYPLQFSFAGSVSAVESMDATEEGVGARQSGLTADYSLILRRYNQPVPLGKPPEL